MVKKSAPDTNITAQESVVAPAQEPIKEEKIDYYYLNTKRKVTDFLIGFFGMIIANVIINTIRSFGMYKLLGYNSMGSSLFLLPTFFTYILGGVGITLGFTLKRRFIAKGIILALLLPIILMLLLFGACLIGGMSY